MEQIGFNPSDSVFLPTRAGARKQHAVDQHIEKPIMTRRKVLRGTACAGIWVLDRAAAGIVGGIAWSVIDPQTDPAPIRAVAHDDGTVEGHAGAPTVLRVTGTLTGRPSILEGGIRMGSTTG